MHRLITLSLIVFSSFSIHAQTKPVGKPATAPSGRASQKAKAASLKAKPATAPAAKSAPANVLVDRVDTTGFIRLDAESFSTLTPREQALAYWLSEAAIAIDPIIYDQLAPNGLRLKQLLDGILAYPQGIRGEILEKVRRYTRLVWANRGNHNLTTSQKFFPEFSEFEWEVATTTAQKNGAYRTSNGDLQPLMNEKDVLKALIEVSALVFDRFTTMMITAKTPPGGLDILTASSNTFYRNVTLADLGNFNEKYPLNSRLVKDPEAFLKEIVYRAGTPNGEVPAGLYALYLKKAIECLEKARIYADPQQTEVIANLIRYFQTGEHEDWLKFGEKWVQTNSVVDFNNGFIEIYRDARGTKGSMQSFVTVTDKPLSDKMVKLAKNADYFEKNAPWDERFKRKTFNTPIVKAVESLIETGDFHANTIGDNLPNENEIREKFGSKNFLFTSSSRAIREAAGNSAEKEFVLDPLVIARDTKYGAEAQDLNTALHEVIGHGSGKLSDKLKNGAQPALREFYSTLEESRADLMSLWYVWDPKLKELGLISNQVEVAKALYDTAALTAIQQLRRIPKGNVIEEDHQRNRQFIIRFIEDRFVGSIEQYEKDGKTYIRVADYQKMRKGVGALLAELMRIKAEGDFDTIQLLVNRYGVIFDPKLRDQVLERYAKLNLPVYWAGINARLTPQFGPNGEITKVELSYPSSPEDQYLGYAAMYDKSLAERPTK